MRNKNIMRILFVIAVILAIKIYYLDMLNLTNKNYDIVSMKVEESISDVKELGDRELSHF